MMEKQTDNIAEQAAAHFARRHGATLSERGARDAWLSDDPDHARAYAQTRRVWDHAARLRDDPELQALMASDLAAVRYQRRLVPQRWLAVAATLVLLMGAGLLATRFIQPPEPLTYVTALGERRTETLPDGTQIVLNTNSMLEVRYQDDHRQIELARGEVQFEVARDAARPFVVRIGTDTVTALGTRFQVRRDLNSTAVTLLEGSVEVASGDEHHLLQPNERAVLSRRTGIAITPVDPELSAGWLEGWLRFRDTSLAEVITEANRYSGKKLRLGNPRLADVRLSGNFHAGDSDSIAQAASLILPVRVERRGNDLVLLPE